MAVWEVIDSGQPAAVPHLPGTRPPPQPASDPGALRTEKLKVPGGWLYRVVGVAYGAAGKGLPPALAMVFVPDNSGERA